MQSRFRDFFRETSVKGFHCVAAPPCVGIWACVALPARKKVFKPGKNYFPTPTVMWSGLSNARSRSRMAAVNNRSDASASFSTAIPTEAFEFDFALF